MGLNSFAAPAAGLAGVGYDGFPRHFPSSPIRRRVNCVIGVATRNAGISCVMYVVSEGLDIDRGTAHDASGRSIAVRTRNIISHDTDVGRCVEIECFGLSNDIRDARENPMSRVGIKFKSARQSIAADADSG